MSKQEESEKNPKKKTELKNASGSTAQLSAATSSPQTDTKEDDSSSDEGRMQIVLEDLMESPDDDDDVDSSASEVDADNSAAVPTTIIDVHELDDEPDVPAAVLDESIIPTTVDTSDDHEPPVITETSAAAFNSFWKYKKVPKGPKVKQTYELEIPDFSDPAKPLVFTDPVFDKTQQNVVNYGKVRVGEGNDITPNPEKLLRLGTAIQDVNDRMLSLGNNSVEKREKMKLSSRICRMKRTANHEANKIKFAGLQQEREELCRVIREMKRAQETVGASAATLTDQLYHTKVAGRSSEYVNSVLEGTQQYGERTYLGSDSDSDY